MITMLPFITVYLFLYGKGSDMWLLIPIILLIIIVPKYGRFLLMLYKQSDNEKKFVLCILVSSFLGICLALLPKHTFYGQSFLTYALFIWYFYLSAFYSGRVYNKNIELAESTGLFNKKRD